MSVASSANRPVPPLRVIPQNLTLGRIATGHLLGLNAEMVQVEVACRRGPSVFSLAGLAEAAVREARIRVKSALEYRGIHLDEYALTVSLAPADLKKSGSGFDLPLALAILVALGQIPAPALASIFCVGELGLDGEIRPVSGILPLITSAKQAGFKRVLVPFENRREAAEVGEVDVFAAAHLNEVRPALFMQTPESAVSTAKTQKRKLAKGNLFDSIRGQAFAKRALIIAAAGGHNLLLVGPPGAGKSLMARSLNELLEPLERDEALETTALHSISGLAPAQQGLIWQRPFRAPHHTVSDVGLVGGGSTPRPGEISLAHNGILFLDELPEFRRSALEALRQPLENHFIHLTRSRAKVRFPAKVQLIAAMNPCPCGYFGDIQTHCRCSKEQRQRYLARLSGPLLDRLDLQVKVPASRLFEKSVPGAAHAERMTSGTLPAAAEVHKARQLQRLRHQKGLVSARTNSQLSLDELERVFMMSRAVKQDLRFASERLGLTARGAVRTLRIARTLADLDGDEKGTAQHIKVALTFRLIDIWREQTHGTQAT